MQSEPLDAQRRKQFLREQGLTNRRTQQNKDEVSEAICERFAALAEYAAARTVLAYLDARSEVRTRQFLPRVLADGKRLVVPYLAGEVLKLFHLENLDELAIGRFQILEPLPELAARTEKQVATQEIDLVIVPGVAFDRRGGRLGHGMGYYDKLLARLRPEVPLIALAFECQVLPEVPMLEHDVFMNKIVTEQAVYAIDRARVASD